MQLWESMIDLMMELPQVHMRGSSFAKEWLRGSQVHKLTAMASLYLGGKCASCKAFTSSRQPAAAYRLHASQPFWKQVCRPCVCSHVCKFSLRRHEGIACDQHTPKLNGRQHIEHHCQPKGNDVSVESLLGVPNLLYCADGLHLKTVSICLGVTCSVLLGATIPCAGYASQGYAATTL